MSQTQETRNQKLVSCIIKRLKSVLGESVTNVLIHEFETKTGLSSEDISNRPDAFDAFLEGFFGVWGASFIENMLVEEIAKSFSIPSNCASFESVIKAATVS